MKIEFDVSDYATEKFYEAILAGLPSFTPEERKAQLDKVGKEGLCKENFAQRMFLEGFTSFINPGVAIANAAIKADVLGVYQRVTQKLIDLRTIVAAKVKAAEEAADVAGEVFTGLLNKTGPASQDAMEARDRMVKINMDRREVHGVLTGVDLVLAEWDKEFKSEDVKIVKEKPGKGKKPKRRKK